MRTLDWFLAAVIGLFLAGGLAWQTLTWMAEVRQASRGAVVAIAVFESVRPARLSPLAGQRTMVLPRGD
jgi:hypothetical protein